MATFRIRPGLMKSDPNPQSSRSLNVRFGARWRATAQNDQLLLEQEILRDHRSHATGATQLRGHDGQVKQREQEVLHARDSVGQTSGTTQPRLTPRFRERIGNSRRTRSRPTPARPSLVPSDRLLVLGIARAHLQGVTQGNEALASARPTSPALRIPIRARSPIRAASISERLLERRAGSLERLHARGPGMITNVRVAFRPTTCASSSADAGRFRCLPDRDDRRYCTLQ